VVDESGRLSPAEDDDGACSVAAPRPTLGPRGGPGIVLATRSNQADVASARAADELAALGFVVHADLPDRPGPARLLVALRDHPTLQHYDPELVEYWVSEAGRGRPRMLTRESRLPIDTDFAWGLIRLVDRLDVSNEYLTFGGRLEAQVVDGVVVAVFSSPAPLLRRGGHSQGWDHGAEAVGAFFGRLLVAVDYSPGFEAALAAASPLARWSAFVAHTVARYRASPSLREVHPALWALLQAEEARLRLDRPSWRAGLKLLVRMRARAISPFPVPPASSLAGGSP
jgi:hypothetical protein